MEHDRDPGLDRLTHEARQRGVAPPRDLWPDIDAAIRRREQAGDRRPRRTWWRAAAAMAALLVVLVGARDLLETAPPGPVALTGPQSGRLDPAPRDDSGIKGTIELALGELGDALAEDPDNHNLSRLVLMVHKARGELLRRSPDQVAQGLDNRRRNAS